MSDTKIIETERLLLRPFRLEDSEECYRNYTSDPSTTLYLTWDAHENVEMTKNFILSKIPLYDKENYYDWCVTRKNSDGTYTIIGAISAVNFLKKDKFVEIGYCYGSDFWHKGYATEALSAAIEFFFEYTDIQVISCRFISANTRSEAVMKKCHLLKTAVLKGFGYNSKENIREDIIVRSIDKDRYLKFRKKKWIKCVS